MKVLFCVSECAPIIKVGGLGDVAGSLPKALARLGVDIRIVVPKYEDIKTAEIKKLGETGVEFGGRKEKVVIWETILPDSKVPVYLLENETYLSKNGHQAFAGTEKETERFAFFSKSIAELLITHNSSPITIPDLLHLNDWHTSLIPLLLSNIYHPPSVLTIHNLSYQGIGSLGLLDKLGLKSDSCRVLKWDAENRDIDILMEGIIHATFVNTVSPTYAKEIMTPQFGWGIEEVLKGKEGRVVGILNGIDYEVWNPTTDKFLDIRYQVSGISQGKMGNKKFLQKELGLAVDEKIPLLAFVGRLEPQQKGLEILLGAMEELLPKENFQFVLLGTGNKDWEEKYQVLSSKYQANFKFICRFDEKLAHQLYASADLFLLPSLFEPCGLPQMIGMRYGALPLVRKTGGLADTVKDGETGFVFEEYSSGALTETIERAIKLSSNQELWSKMVEDAMRQDFSWEASAREYLELYKEVIKLHNRE